MVRQVQDIEAETLTLDTTVSDVLPDLDLAAAPGLFDELSIFNRAFTPAEVQALHALPRGVSGLLQ